MINNNIPHLSDKKSTFLTLSVAIALLLLASPLLSNFLLQPVQASQSISGARTQAPVDGTLSCGGGANPIDAKLTFTVQGTSIDNEWYNIHNGTFQLTNSSNGQVLYSYSGGNQAGEYISIDNRYTWTIVPGFGLDGGKFLCGDSSITMYVTTTCNSEFENITINRGTGGSIGTFPNAVIQCGDFGDGDTTTAQQPSSSSHSPMTETTTQDGDRGSSNRTDSNSGSSSNSRDGDSDGIPDSSDNCPHNSYHRCFKEGTSTTSTQEQQPSNGIGNQTGQ
jgi:hypothetical protein